MIQIMNKKFNIMSWVSLEFVVLFLYIIFFSENKRQIQDNLALSLSNLEKGKIWTILTSNFTHFTMPHFLFNMIGIYFILPTTIRLMGFRPTTYFILGSCLASPWLYLLDRPKESGLIGASGICTSLIGFISVFTNFKVLLYMVIPVQLRVFCFGMCAYDFGSWYMINTGRMREDGIAHEAHLMGTAYGILTALFIRRFMPIYYNNKIRYVLAFIG